MPRHMHEFRCAAPGCERGPSTGHALYRTSPMGQDFAGRCGDHIAADGADDVTRDICEAIEEANGVR